MNTHTHKKKSTRPVFVFYFQLFLWLFNLFIEKSKERKRWRKGITNESSHNR